MLLEKYTSKITCLACEEKAVATFENEKSDGWVYYHCMNCGYRYSLDPEQRKFYKGKGKKKAGDDQPWQTGTLLILLMLATIVAINVSENRGTSEPAGNRPDQPSTWIIE